jgi:hypothetical protein
VYKKCANQRCVHWATHCAQNGNIEVLVTVLKRQNKDILSGEWKKVNGYSIY